MWTLPPPPFRTKGASYHGNAVFGLMYGWTWNSKRVWASGEQTDTLSLQFLILTVLSWNTGCMCVTCVFVWVCVCELVQGQTEGEERNRREKVIFGDTDCWRWINEISCISTWKLYRSGSSVWITSVFQCHTTTSQWNIHESKTQSGQTALPDQLDIQIRLERYSLVLFQSHYGDAAHKHNIWSAGLCQKCKCIENRFFLIQKEATYLSYL